MMILRIVKSEELRKRRDVVVAGGTEAVADPWLGDGVGWLVGGLDFFSQLADGDAQIFGLIGVGAPHGVEESAVCDGLAGVMGHVHQKVESRRPRVCVL